jgi:hypothetical protein
MPTDGSPASNLWSVATETPNRAAQDRSDSLRRKRATARSAPSLSRAAAVLGGSWIRARAVFGIPIEYDNNAIFVNIYKHILLLGKVINGSHHDRMSSFTDQDTSCVVETAVRLKSSGDMSIRLNSFSACIAIWSADRFMSEARALTNLIGNGVAAIVVARWEGSLDRVRMQCLLMDPE